MNARLNIMGVLVALAVASVSCGGGELRPAEFQTGHNCANCRMAVSDVHFAGQVVASGEEPRFYDDIGCLASALGSGTLPSGAVAFVADHRTGAWTSATGAVYTRVDTLETPMRSHLIAHADAASRDQDPAAAGGVHMTADEALKRR